MIFTKNVRNQVNKNLNSNELTKNQSKLCLKPLNIRFENNNKLFYMFYLILMVRPERGTVKGVV